MFVQIVRAPLVGGEDKLLTALDRWDAELRPGAKGFLGSTAGVTTEGEVVLIARFQDEAAARANSDREEQGKWWAELESYFGGPAKFLESSEVDVSMGGGSDDAGFVQVMVGTADRAKASAAIERAEPILQAERPDILGGMTVWLDDGGYVDVAYFTSESAAREGEAKELSEAGQRAFEEFSELMSVETYLDIPAPRFS